MVEAIVTNGDVEGAYELIHELRDDEHCRDCLNSVVYCSLLKGFTAEKKMDRAWVVYDEMINTKIDFSIITFNTMINACARCGRMDEVPKLQRDMAACGVKPTVITYSTMIK